MSDGSGGRITVTEYPRVNDEGKQLAKEVVGWRTPPHTDPTDGLTATAYWPPQRRKKQPGLMVRVV